MVAEQIKHWPGNFDCSAEALKKLQAQLTIDVAESANAVWSDAHVREGVGDFTAARPRVLLARHESLALCVPLVTRRTIRDVRDNCVPQSGEESTGTDRFVVWVSGYAE